MNQNEQYIIDYYKQLLKERCVSSANMESSLEYLTYDGRTKCTNDVQLYLFPKTVNEIQQILKFANTHNIAIIPQAGNTNRVASGTYQIKSDPFSNAHHFVVTVNMLYMNKVPYISLQDRIGVFESGCTLSQVKAICAKEKLDFPLDLAPKNRVQIGGAIANAAGGLSVISYGKLASNILGLEVVLADGSLMDMIHYTLKHNVGISFYPLFVGSLGTLGIITKASVRLVPLVDSQTQCYGFYSFKEVLYFMRSIGTQTLFKRILSLEFLDKAALKTTPLPLKFYAPFPYLVLVKYEVNGDENDKKFTDVFQQDTLFKGTKLYIPNIWEYRENISKSAHEHYPYSLHTDFALPLAYIELFMNSIHTLLSSYSSSLVPIFFGHLGDGNIHFNVYSSNKNDCTYFLKIYEFSCAFIIKYKGSLSAEHGVGRTNHQLFLQIPKQQRHIMQQLKTMFDPNGIMNPGIF